MTRVAVAKHLGVPEGAGLKTWLETGEVLTTPGSLMYQPADG